MKKLSLSTLVVLALSCFTTASMASVQQKVVNYKQVVFVDSGVKESEILLKDITSDVEIIHLKKSKDGIEQIAKNLQDKHDLETIHIISHGSAGSLTLGTAKLTTSSMKVTQGKNYRDTLKAIGRSLTTQGDILIYGCDFAKGKKGEQAVSILAKLTAISL